MNQSVPLSESRAYFMCCVNSKLVFKAASRCGNALNEIATSEFNRKDDERWSSGENPKQIVLVITNKETTDSVAQPIRKVRIDSFFVVFIVMATKINLSNRLQV